MLSRFSILFSSIIAIVMGILQLIGVNVYLGKSGKIEASIENAIFFICFGLLLLFLLRFIKEPKEKITKCPKCKEVFNCNELIDGKCKYCKDVDTIDINKYFKQYPNELEDKEK